MYDNRIYAPLVTAIILLAGSVRAAADPYTLGISREPAEGGAFHVEPDLNSYEPGAMVTVYAIPFEGFEFAGWMGDIEADESKLSFLMTADTSLTAVFEPTNEATQAFQLWVFSEPQESGWVRWEGAKETYSLGDEVTLTAVPAEGHAFGGWTGDVPEAANAMQPELRLMVTDNLNLTANFDAAATVSPGNASGTGAVGCGALGMLFWPLIGLCLVSFRKR